MTKKQGNILYVEPEEYIPEEIRKELGLGEYNTDVYPESGESEKKDDNETEEVKAEEEA